MKGFVAAQTYNPGEVIFTEEAFAKVLSRKRKNTFCEFCCERLPNLKHCAKCGEVKYCSKSCQRKDWPDHRLECKHLKNLPVAINVDYIRLLGRIVFKIKGNDWKTIKRSILGKEVSFDDIEPCFKHRMENPKNRLFHEETKEFLRSYIGDENMPTDDEMTKIITKVRPLSVLPTDCNSLTDPISQSFFFGPSLLDIECVPNSSFCVIKKKTLKIWASRSIEKGSEKISISMEEILPFDMKYEKDPCSCTDCSLPYGESILTKIIQEKKAYSAIKLSEEMIDGITGAGNIALRLPPRYVVNSLLQLQSIVLGDTNKLHLKLLAFKGLEMGEDVFEALDALIELETLMRFIFGGFYSEMEEIYRALLQINTFLGNIVGVCLYSAKLKKLQALSCGD